MHKTMGTALVLLLAAGCSNERLGFEYESQMFAETRGLAMHDDGQVGHASMDDVNCEFTVQGMIRGEYDITDQLEHVQDAMGTTVLVQSPKGIHLIRDAQWTGRDDVEIENVLQSRMYDGGVAVLRDVDGQLAVEWHGVESPSAVVTNLPSGLQTAFTVNRFTGDAYVATVGQVVQVTRDGVLDLQASGNVAVYDSEADVLFMAEIGDSILQGTSVSGGVEWIQDLGSPIISMDVIGSEQLAAVITENDNGTGVINVVDATTGVLEQTVRTPTVAEIEVSGDGGTIALVTPDEVHFYGVERGPGVDVYWSKEAAGVQPPPAFAD